MDDGRGNLVIAVAEGTATILGSDEKRPCIAALTTEGRLRSF